ncbi:MAG: metal-dependent transcriptional regulator [Candidatus Odinarchaeota archaeon]
MEINEKRIEEILSRLRPIEEEIFEVLFDLSSERGADTRVKMKEILDLVGSDRLSKAQLTNIIRRKLEELEWEVATEGERQEKMVEQLLDYLPYEGVLLTDAGYAIAKVVQRNHRLAEALLGNILKMSWQLVHDQACFLEHGITEDIAGAILSKLGPSPHTPYGFPIPSGDSKREIFKFDDISLEEAPLNEVLVLQRIKPAPKLLRELKKAFITSIGARIRKVREESGKITVVALDNSIEIILDSTAGQRLFVTVER